MVPRRLLLLAALCLGIGVATLSGQQPQGGPPDAVEDEILVKFRPEADDVRRDAALAAIGGQRIKRFKELHVDHVRIPRGRRAADVIAGMLASPDVVAAQPNYVRRGTFPSPPDDPFWLSSQLWGLPKIQADTVWSVYNNKGSSSIIVADIDTGVKYDHPDLAANMWVNPGEIAGNGIDDDGNGYVDDVRGIDTINDDSDPMDDNGHGTHTAGTIGAVGNNGVGVVGVNWAVTILPCKFLGADGSGTDAGAIECFNYITWLKLHGVDIRVSNNSWGSYRNPSAPFPQLLKDAIDAAGDAGIINVFAAGNDNLNIEMYPHDPASFTSPSIVSVAASKSNDGKAQFSNYGVVSVDLAAPGEGIVSTWIAALPTCTTCYAQLSGTSMAAPHVAGAAALLLAQSPSLPVPAIKSLLIQNVTSLSGWATRVASGGRLNVFTAAGAVATNTPPAVTITSPAAGTVFPAGSIITVSATATDNVSVTKVEFFANGVSLGIDTTSPYSITAADIATGNYNLTAVATDNLGATAVSPPIAVTVGIPQEEITQAVTRGGLRLQQLQNADGGWFFRATDTGCSAVPGASCTNIIGVTGLGLLSAYSRTGDALVLADAVAAGQLLKSIHLAAPAQQPFSQDLEFLRALATASGDPQYAALATSWFGTITAMHPAAVDRADWAFARRDVSRIRSLAVWDLASTIRSAKAAGQADYATALANRVIAREAEWMDKDVAHRWDQCAVAAGCGPADNPRAFDYTLLGMGSMLWAIHDLPGFTATTDDYRSWLLEQQDASGTWDVGNLQITSYAALGLGAVGGAGTSAAIETAVRFLLANQQPDFGWPFSIVNGVAGAEFTTVDSEVMRAIDLLYSTGSGFSVTVAPAQLATVTFEAVAAAGSTTVIATSATAVERVPPGYALLSGLTYEVATTAAISGKTVMCLLLPWDAAADFESVRLLQPRKQKLVDVTIRKGPHAPDASAKRVCAELDSLEPVSVAIAKQKRP